MIKYHPSFKEFGKVINKNLYLLFINEKVQQKTDKYVSMSNKWLPSRSLLPIEHIRLIIGFLALISILSISIFKKNSGNRPSSLCRKINRNISCMQQYLSEHFRNEGNHGFLDELDITSTNTTLWTLINESTTGDIPYVIRTVCYQIGSLLKKTEFASVGFWNLYFRFTCVINTSIRTCIDTFWYLIFSLFDFISCWNVEQNVFMLNSWILFHFFTFRNYKNSFFCSVLRFHFTHEINKYYKGRRITKKTSILYKIPKFVSINFQKRVSLSEETVADIMAQKESITRQKMRFFIKDFFNKCDQIRNKLTCFIKVMFYHQIPFGDNTIHIIHFKCKAWKSCIVT